LCARGASRKLVIVYDGLELLAVCSGRVILELELFLACSKGNYPSCYLEINWHASQVLRFGDAKYIFGGERFILNISKKFFWAQKIWGREQKF